MLVVEGMYAEPGAPPDPALSADIESLASFAGTGSGTSMKPAAYFHVGAVADGRDDRPD